MHYALKSVFRHFLVSVVFGEHVRLARAAVEHREDFGMLKCDGVEVAVEVGIEVERQIV